MMSSPFACSTNICLCLPACLSACLFLSVCLCLSFCVCVSLSLSVSVCLSVSLSLCLPCLSLSSPYTLSMSPYPLTRAHEQLSELLARDEYGNEINIISRRPGSGNKGCVLYTEVWAAPVWIDSVNRAEQLRLNEQLNNRPTTRCLHRWQSQWKPVVLPLGQ